MIMTPSTTAQVARPERFGSATVRGPMTRNTPVPPRRPDRDRAAACRPLRELVAPVLGALVLPLALATSAQALEPGDLDTNFSTDGIVVAPAAPGGNDSEGRAVATVTALFGPQIAVFGWDFSANRLAFSVSSAGSPQASFDGSFVPADDDGLAINPGQLPPAPHATYNDAIATVTCSSFICSFSFSVAGSHHLETNEIFADRKVFVVSRISKETGRATAERSGLSLPGSEDSEVFGIAQRSDGDLIAVGHWGLDLLVVRLNSDLTFDTSFGGGDGIVSYPATAFCGSVLGQAVAYEVALQSNGRIVVVGACPSGSLDSYDSPHEWPPKHTKYTFVARLTSIGALDTTFGTGGRVLVFSQGSRGTFTGVTIASDGDIVASGFDSCEASGTECGGSGFVRRYTSTGAPDTTFGGGDGEVRLDTAGFQGAEFDDVVLDSENRITAVGSKTEFVSLQDGFEEKALLVRYTSTGVLDSTFAGNGIATFRKTPGFSGVRIMSAEMSADGLSITVGGTMYSVTSGNDRMFVARVIGGDRLCGNGTVDSGETCDLGDGLNGTSSGCCTSECNLVASGTQCRAGFGDPNGSGFVCDPAEVCTGTTATCPTDSHHDFTICRTGAGLNDLCDPHEICPAGAGSVCGADVKKTAGTVCRQGSGDNCDPTERCTGVARASCPSQVLLTSTTVCRASVDPTCDVAEKCPGTAGVACPADVGVAAGTTCRAAVDVCDLAETCSATTCPADQKKPDSDADTRCDEIDNCDLVANLAQADGDNDTVGDVCDNCPATCNPDQDNSDDDAGGGDVCDVCPAIDESAEPVECANAEYNSALACCRDSAAEGISVDADGPACAAAGTTSFQTPPDPDTGTTVTVKVPSGAVELPTSISVTPMTQGGSDFILSTGIGKFVTGALMEPAGTTFDPPLLICMAWEDSDLPLGRVDNLDFAVDEVNIRPTLLDETTDTEVVLGPRCGLQASCGALGPDGLPASVPGTLTDPALAACCSTSANVYCFEVSHFSAYAIADLSCAGEASARIIATRMEKPVGSQDLKVKGEFNLGGPIAGGLDPATSGFELLLLSAAGTPLYQVTLPAGTYSRETGEGWQTSRRGGSAQWKSKDGISSVDKVKLDWNDASGRGSFDLKGKGLSLAVTASDLPLQAEVRLDPSALAGHCGVATWTPPGGVCTFNSSGSTLLCQ